MADMTDFPLHRQSKRCMERAQRPISRTGMRARSSRGSLRADSSIQSTALEMAHMGHMIELTHCNSSSSEQVMGWTLKCSFHSIRHNSKVKQLALRIVHSSFGSKKMQLGVLSLVHLKNFLPTLEMMIRTKVRALRKNEVVHMHLVQSMCLVLICMKLGWVHLWERWRKFPVLPMI